MPLGQELVLNEEGKLHTVPTHSAPILCQAGVNLVTEAEFQYLLLSAEQAEALRTRVPAFRFFWQEILGLASPESGLG
jgi:hypothetical protein